MSKHPESDEGGQTRRERIPDEEIAAGVRKALLTKLQFQMHPVGVNVRDGVVTLRGVLESAELRQEAAQLAVMAPGVRDVLNLIGVPGDRA